MPNETYDAFADTPKDHPSAKEKKEEEKRSKPYDATRCNGVLSVLDEVSRMCKAIIAWYPPSQSSSSIDPVDAHGFDDLIWKLIYGAATTVSDIEIAYWCIRMSIKDENLFVGEIWRIVLEPLVCNVHESAIELRDCLSQARTANPRGPYGQIETYIGNLIVVLDSLIPENTIAYCRNTTVTDELGLYI
jgi:hypothetical protein